MPFILLATTTARCVFFSFCFGIDLFISQVDNEALAVCSVSGCKDVDLPSGCSTRWAGTCWKKALSYVSVSLGLYLFLSLSFHLSSLSACVFILDFSSFYVKIIFGFAFSLYAWLGVSQSAP